ncbi:hypothetical protein OH76DRAFT_1360199 [Lentinus brumalis]|uniref:Uncharacterized protein n=1 Tax=Lentinus brumalis TaxID=2498619 RepID=A0A371CUY8_9APHY|nr:hypothetical protein OH76DRAFT_1360199 [Polyporus brumalis]
MAAVPTTLHSWSSDVVEATGATKPALHLAIQALIQNQVNNILEALHVRHWSEWKHEDLRGLRCSTVQKRKKLLLEGYPGLLAGPHALALRHEHWSPCYILSADIPVARLRETPHLQVLNVLWQHQHSKALSLTFYNNHLDNSPSFSDFISEGPSTNRCSQWAVGTSGRGFLRACHYVLGPHQRAQGNMYRLAVALRVGHTTGEFMYRTSDTGKEEFALRRQDLTPLSFQRVNSDKGFSFPFDHLLPLGTPLASKQSRVSAIYNARFLQGLSERLSDVQVAMEPSHERSLVKSDEVVVTIYGLRDPSLSPEYLFSGVYGIFPPPPTLTWAVSAHGQAATDITFFLLPRTASLLVGDGTHSFAETRGRFYYRNYLVPAGPTFNRLCVNYYGDLHLTADGMSVQVSDDLFALYRKNISTAMDTAIRTIPELAVELAYDILTEPGDVADTFGRMLSRAVKAQDDDGKDAYRTAFTKAWCRLDPALSARSVYPYVAGVEGMAHDKALTEQLGLHPISVAAHVKVLLEKVGAYPAIGVYADRLLCSALGTVNVPPGIDVLKRCLTVLFPNLPGGPLSVRQYPYQFPRAVWDAEAQTFAVASAACNCDMREGEPPARHNSDPACMCWCAPVLQEAVLSWHTKNVGRGRPVSLVDHAATAEVAQPLAKALAEKRLFHVLYQNCKFPSVPDVQQETAFLEADEGAELEYADATPVSASVQCDPRSPVAASGSGPGQLRALPSIPPRLARLGL